MDVRYYLDPDTGLPHIYVHGVTEAEVEYLLGRRGEDLAGRDDSRIKLGQTAAGRYLQAVYVPDVDGTGVFVVTAFDMQERAKRAYRRRRRGRGQ
jgi:hypothetical protein